MFDIAWTELLLIGALALIVVGPKDLPVLVRNLGRWVAKLRGLADDFKRGMDDAAREAELDDLRKIGDVGRDIRRDVQRDFDAVGADAKRLIEQPAGGQAGASAAADGAPSGPVEPAFSGQAPRVREADVEPPVAGKAPRGGAQDDDDAFLERFQRGVRGEGAGSP